MKTIKATNQRRRKQQQTRNKRNQTSSRKHFKNKQKDFTTTVTSSMSTELFEELILSIAKENLIVCNATNKRSKFESQVNNSIEFIFRFFELIHESVKNQLKIEDNLNSEIAALIAMKNILYESVKDVDFYNCNYNYFLENCKSEYFEISIIRCMTYVNIIVNIFENKKYDNIINENNLRIDKIIRAKKLKNLDKIAKEDTYEEI